MAPNLLQSIKVLQQCVAVCCSVLQRIAACCKVYMYSGLQCVPQPYTLMQRTQKLAAKEQVNRSLLTCSFAAGQQGAQSFSLMSIS